MSIIIIIIIKIEYICFSILDKNWELARNMT